jgi:acyl-CoA thioester hydrolase
MPSVFSFQRRVEFCETDAAGIAHFSSLIIYMEQAEHALLRSVGLSVAASHSTLGMNDQLATVAYSWPRVKVDCDFRSPARFEDVILIQSSIAQLGSKSITYQHQLTIGSTKIATGKMTSVCCIHQGNSLVGIQIPSSIRELLQPFHDSWGLSISE